MTVLAAIALLLGAIAVLHGRTTPSDRVVARVGSAEVTMSTFERYLAERQAAVDLAAMRRDPSALEQALNDYLDELAVEARAKRLRIESEPKYQKAVELLNLKLLARLMTEHQRSRILQMTRVSSEEVRNYYNSHGGEFLEEPRFTARLLLVYVLGNPAFPEQGLSDAAARRRVMQALAALRAGKSWETVAKTFSDDGATRNQGGLVTDRQFGYFAKEVEAAVRSQPIGKTGVPIKSDFGYHLVQVEARTLEGARRPFESVQGLIEERLTQEKASRARTELMAPFFSRTRFGLKDTGRTKASLLDPTAVREDAVLAEIQGKPVLEADFQWFLKDAFLPSQRLAVFSRPSARMELLESYLDMRVLSAVAKEEKLDMSGEFKRLRADGQQKILREFVEQRDLAGPFSKSHDPKEDPRTSERRYLDGLRKEAHISAASGARAPLVHEGSQ